MSPDENFDPMIIPAVGEPEGDVWEEDDHVGFSRFFTLDEAAAMLPNVRQWLKETQDDLAALKDQIILFKRILQAKGIKNAGKGGPSDEELAHLKELYTKYEDRAGACAELFFDEGIILRDIDEGLIDFPYYAKSVDDVFFLCWKLEEDGIFYFHEPEGGFQGRRPISFLPE